MKERFFKIISIIFIIFNFTFISVKAEEVEKNKKTGIEKVAIYYDFCKGCGICSKVCKLKAITMEVEANE